ncbi:MAG: cytochrome d ubiquinol oxidase subunit II [Mycobacteriaceae bacterium]
MELVNVWFILIAVLFLGYFILEGFDFGVGMLLPIIGSKSMTARSGTEASVDTRRRTVLNTIGPVWDANEVWLLTAGGAMFAAFPEWYATLFSGFYLPLLVILVALIVRVCAIEYRGKINNDNWRRWCDLGIGIGSWIPAILWGVAFANIVRGVAINADKKITSGFFDLLNPYALLGGATTALVFALHGAVFIALKTSGSVHQDAERIAQILAIPAVAVGGAFALWTQLAYGKGWTWVALVLAAVALIAVALLTRMKREDWAFIGTTVAVLATVTLLFGSLFPNVMVSTTDSALSLTVHNASSSAYTLMVMTWAAAAMTPVVMIYQGWTYWVFRRRISTDQIPAGIGLSVTTKS